MEDAEKKAYVFGSIFTLANRLQLLGNRLDPQLTVKQWLFLAGVTRCESDAPTLTEVAARIGTSRQNVKKIAVILEKQGFLTLQTDPEDTRALRIRLTAACMAHLRQREGMEMRFLEEVFFGFNSREAAAFSTLIAKLERNVAGMERDHEQTE